VVTSCGRVSDPLNPQDSGGPCDERERRMKKLLLPTPRSYGWKKKIELCFRKKMLVMLWPSSTFSHLPECIGLSLVSTVDDTHTRVGICLDGANEGKFLVMTTEEDFTECASDVDLIVHMFDSNPFGITAGTKCSISVKGVVAGGTRIILQVNDWGMTMMQNGDLVPVVVTHVENKMNALVHKKRCTLKPAEMPDGSRLNTKDTLRVLAKWLDVQNAKFASKYGLEQLVWAEEQNSSRSSIGGQVRGWFRHDIADGGKRKVCPHASSAIDHMKLVCNVDFYDDMKKNGNMYNN